MSEDGNPNDSPPKHQDRIVLKDILNVQDKSPEISEAIDEPRQGGESDQPPEEGQPPPETKKCVLCKKLERCKDTWTCARCANTAESDALTALLTIQSTGPPNTCDKCTKPLSPRSPEGWEDSLCDDCFYKLPPKDYGAEETEKIVGGQQLQSTGQALYTGQDLTVQQPRFGYIHPPNGNTFTPPVDNLDHTYALPPSRRSTAEAPEPAAEATVSRGRKTIGKLLQQVTESEIFVGAAANDHQTASVMEKVVEIAAEVQIMIKRALKNASKNIKSAQQIEAHNRPLNQQNTEKVKKYLEKAKKDLNMLRSAELTSLLERTKAVCVQIRAPVSLSTVALIYSKVHVMQVEIGTLENRLPVQGN